MREIKFIAYVKFLNEIQNVQELFCDGGVITDDYDYALAHDDIILMQFTGAFDSDSVEIYVDHVCAVEGLGNCRVGICPFYGVTFYAKDNNEWALIDCITEGDSFKVIGNVHENPELLEGNE
jgi:hypothetical protein